MNVKEQMERVCTERRCKLCVMPDTRPDTPFNEEGICQACINYQDRPKVDWEHRGDVLDELIRAGRNDSGYDCIVPSSGGKDSTYQVLKMIELGWRPLVVTASTCHLTEIGRANIDNLARYATTIEVTPNKTVRAKLNAAGLRLVGDISWPEHVSIFTTPFRVAAQYGIPLIIYGENPQNQYGGPHGTEEAVQLTQRWRSEFGGFLGLRPADMIGIDDISASDMNDYLMPPKEVFEKVGVQAHFLGQYIPWDSRQNAHQAKAAGMQIAKPAAANWWAWENMDNAQTGIHDYFMYRKYGYGRGCTQISVDVRAGVICREDALEWVLIRDGAAPIRYAGVDLLTVLEKIGISWEEYYKLADQFTNWDIFRRTEDNATVPSMLI